MQTNLEIIFGGERLLLNSDRTLWWPAQDTLFATDLHAGKTEHMRHHGLAIPGGSLERDLAILRTAAERHHAKRLIFLGDLFHSEHNNEWAVLAAWCQTQPFDIALVRGNHDRFLTDEQIEAAGMAVHPEPYVLGPFTLRHHPHTKQDEAYTLAGHVHPVYNLKGVAKDRMRLPCFWVQERQIILPSFGSFTGGFKINGRVAVHIYACAADGSAIITAK